MKNIILLAPPAAGKGTQASKIIEEYGIAHISTGDLLREKIKDNTPLSNKIKEYIENGDLVPDNIILELISERINKQDCQKGCILDGFPRNYEQAIQLDYMLSNQDKKIGAVINLEVSKEVLKNRIVGRLLCQECNAIYNDQIENMKPKIENVCDMCGSKLIKRSDDNEETFNTRYETYLNQTIPLVDYYNNKGILYSVNSEVSVSDVFESIKKIIDNL